MNDKLNYCIFNLLYCKVICHKIVNPHKLTYKYGNISRVCVCVFVCVCVRERERECVWCARACVCDQSRKQTKQTRKQTIKKANRTNKQVNKQTNKQTNQVSSQVSK